VAFQFGQIVIRACPPRELFLRVVPEERARNQTTLPTWIPVNNDMLLRQCSREGHQQTARVGFKLVVFLGPRSPLEVIVRRTASSQVYKWPSMRLLHVGVLESSKSP